MSDPQILRLSAFTDDPAGGNPAGVVLDAAGLDGARMLALAAQVGYSETAFVGAADASGRRRARYFSPAAEVDFCGHATIAAAVAIADREGPGTVHLVTNSGPVTVRTRRVDGSTTATLTSPPAHSEPIAPEVRADLLAALDLSTDDLDASLPVPVAYAGNLHPVVAVRTRSTLAALAPDLPRLSAVMGRERWTTVQTVWREGAHTFWSRNPFPAGDVVEDPATGAAAAALGGYLRDLAAIDVPARITVHQGHDMGRPSLLSVEVHAGIEEIDVTGSAVSIT